VVGVLVTSGVIVDVIINNVVVVVATAFTPGKVVRECCVFCFGVVMVVGVFYFGVAIAGLSIVGSNGC
jgi:hypothetical protein